MFRAEFPLMLTHKKEYKKQNVPSSFQYTVVSLENGRSTLIYSEKDETLTLFERYLFDIEISPGAEKTYIKCHGIRPLPSTK